MRYNQITSNVITTAPENMDEITSLDPSETITLTCISLQDELLIIDCGARIEKAFKFRKYVEEYFNKDLSHLVLTHWHWDHSDALEVFHDVPIVISKIGARKLTHPFKVEVDKKLTFGSKRNQLLLHVVGGHSPDSAYIFYPSERYCVLGIIFSLVMRKYFRMVRFY